MTTLEFGHSRSSVELFFLCRFRSLGLGNQIDAERMKHLDHGTEFRPRLSAQCPVQILARESGFFRYRAHSSRAGDRAYRNGDGRCVLGLESFVDVGGDHLRTVEIFGCIEGFCFGYLSSPTHPPTFWPP